MSPEAFEKKRRLRRTGLWMSRQGLSLNLGSPEEAAAGSAGLWCSSSTRVWELVVALKCHREGVTVKRELQDQRGYVFVNVIVIDTCPS